ncbi:hypothetical protein [Halalkalibacter oceani]|uniref:hypothetical protein n=1 Tax=Halalkalibacter oceani TaxID=1653776 RepID=UPI0033939CA5
MKYYVHPKHIVTRFEDIEGESALLETYNGVQYGTGTDDCLAVNLLGHRDIISKQQQRDYIKVEVDLNNLTKKQSEAANGYLEMSQINLEIANEFYYAEQGGERTASKLLNDDNADNK